MTARELAKLVLECRKAQKKYFRTRREDVLEESRRREKELDAAIEAILRQPTLPGIGE